MKIVWGNTITGEKPRSTLTILENTSRVVRVVIEANHVEGWRRTYSMSGRLSETQRADFIQGVNAKLDFANDNPEAFYAD